MRSLSWKKSSFYCSKNKSKKLDGNEFDLEAWKGSAISLLTRIYGEKDQKVERISKMTIDYSSWALRDSKSTYNPLESCKKQGREIMEMCLDEIKNFGAPGLPISQTINSIKNTLEDELKVSQFKGLKKALSNPQPTEGLIKEISKWDELTSNRILASVLIHLDLKNRFELIEMINSNYSAALECLFQQLIGKLCSKKGTLSASEQSI